MPRRLAIWRSDRVAGDGVLRELEKAVLHQSGRGSAARGSRALAGSG